MKNADMPAMPQSSTSDGYPCNYADYGGVGIPTGLTKREIMAMYALQGLLSGSDINELVVGDERSFSEAAVDYADALLAALEEKQ